uniref:CFAP61 dimerisation domain-containing protein n=1 Tax=Strombidium inclinatum TaxID=197538 RepID=A0A7S3MYV1_9SPIT
MHRDSLFDQDMEIHRITSNEIEAAQDLVSTLDESKKMKEALYDCAVNPASTNYGFVAKVMDEIIGAFVVSKDVNLEYYISHFHIQDQILIAEQDRKSHTRMIYSCVNPIFEKSTRYMLKELLRLTQKTCLYFEVNTATIIPTIFHELVHIRSRRFPHFLDRKWDHERFDSEDTKKKKEEDTRNKVDGCNRDPLDEKEAPFALCFSTRRMLSEAKIIKNARIVVVGASDTSISFIEALLSISYLQFTNIVLVAPGGLPHNHFVEKKENLKCYSTSYTTAELKKLMLESRVRVINARMVDIDRSDKNIVLHDDTILPYDTLILGMGIQDKTLNTLGYASRGIASTGDLQRADQILSIDDPHLYQHLRVGGSLINILTDKKRVKNCVIYGRTLHTYCCIQGLLQRGVKPEQIILAIPASECHVEENYDEVEERLKDMPFIYPEAFEDYSIEEKIQSLIESMGVTIIKNTRLIEIIEDPEEGLEAVLFKMLDIPDEEEEEEDLNIEEKSEGQESMGSNAAGTEEKSFSDENKENEAEYIKQKKKRKKNEKEVECRVLISAGHKDVDQDVFSAIHNNGLVYNGRLIVDKNFQTTDPSIFAAGSLCEFSGRYKALAQGKPLRMDRYNGREMGSRLARSVFDIYDTQANQEGEEELPSFYLPVGHGGVLPGDILYYHIKTTNPLLLNPNSEEVENRKSLTCDNLNGQKGHFIKFTFNSIGLIDSVTYMGSEEVVLQSLWSFVGLHENYLNQLTSRFEEGIIPNVVEFLSENWAIALYHEWFGDFCLRMRQSVQRMTDVQAILEKAFEMTKNGEGIAREQIEELKKYVDPKTVRMVQDETLEFIKTNMNHLPMYYIPQKEFE